MSRYALALVLALLPAVALAGPGGNGKGGGKGGGGGGGEAIDLQPAFEAIRADAVWPAPASSRDLISSTFGPRIASPNRYDWHRGLDIHGEVGEPILAVSDAVFSSVENFTNGGLTVVLEHEFAQPVSFQGSEVTKWYTFYMHMDSVEPALLDAEANGTHPLVAAGEQIGTLGESGSALSPHLHLEVRVGSRCSLEYQLANPSSSCAGYGFDPHVHPLRLAEALFDDLTVSLLTELGPGTDAVIEVSTLDQQPHIARYEFQVRNKRRVVRSHVLDLDLREGFDPTSTAALDTQDTSRPYLDPLPFGYSRARWTTHLVIPSEYVSSKAAGETFRVIVTDLQGATTQLDFGQKNASW